MTGPRSVPDALPPVTEAELQRQVIDLAHIFGWRVMHVRKSIGRRAGGAAWQTTTSIKGWVDLFLYHPDRGQVLAAELKSDSGRLTPEQIEVLDDLRRSGVQTRVWRPGDWEEIQAVLTGRVDAVR